MMPSGSPLAPATPMRVLLPLSSRTTDTAVSEPRQESATGAPLNVIMWCVPIPLHPGWAAAENPAGIALPASAVRMHVLAFSIEWTTMYSRPSSDPVAPASLVRTSQ